MVSDSELIRKCKAGNAKYQAMLYEKFAPALMAICIRYTRCQEDAQDILHDSFIKILTNIDTCNEEGNIIGWMRTITINTAINAYNKRKKEGGKIEAEEVEENVKDVRIEQNDFLSESTLLRFVSELPDGYRTVFNMFEIDGYSHMEIANMTGSSYSTVRSQLFKAKRALKQKIEEYLGKELEDHINTKQ